MTVVPMVFSGCRGSQLGEHRWGGGPMGQGDTTRQQARAVYFDPYPLNDIGPEVVGGRPRGFMNPLAEAHRNELKVPDTLRDPWAGYRP
jgi:hypothetical protein